MVDDMAKNILIASSEFHMMLSVRGAAEAKARSEGSRIDDGISPLVFDLNPVAPNIEP